MTIPSVFYAFRNEQNLCLFQTDSILDMAGSRDGAWSTNLSPNSAIKPPAGETIMMNGEPVNSVCNLDMCMEEYMMLVNSSDKMSLFPGKVF